MVAPHGPWRFARAPGSTANLGPGFDALGLAIPFETRVWARPNSRFVVRLAGTGGSERLDSGHLIARALSQVAREPVELVVASDIPLARGLGSSGSLALALAAALGATDPLAAAIVLEGHPENAAASALGGAVVAVGGGGDELVLRRVALDARLRLVLVVPERRLATAEARAVVARTLSLEDAVFNLQRVAALVASLGDVEALAPLLFEDRLHQPWRERLFPEAVVVRDALIEAGCRGAAWSGAGPSLVGFVEEERAPQAAEAVRASLVRVAIGASVHVVAPDLRGLVVGSEPPPPALAEGPAVPFEASGLG
ncbi:Homoserine kinase [Acidimicrobium ferrooxidans DSM 10331]|uniref:Homoserine kinase n=1 Tax=Acidimicrobium ferrooxidans (strain DSM 10331 / JCM 15462 / NBRC 103882 / ICP) TaxID=525909 RepID=C7LXZ6_ACIFD|nr:hypothetical protein [Acidimicrobium ferrooxidans]ACU53604.1 Homoserine kinase [Acidimicrobium ferrooxidans DSM 10331]